MAVAAGEVRRFAVHMPPRHGKSELVSRYFPAWFLGSFPDRRIILASYGDEFAADWGRKVRDVVEEFGAPLFGIRVRADSSAADRWDLAGRDGGMKTTGVGGSLTGRGAHLLLIDDPVKNAREAQSATIRRVHWEWYQSTAYNRLEPGGAIVLIMTRWHEDDLGGRIREQARQSGERWEVLNLPALAEEGDPLSRPEGEPLWPARFGREELTRIRATVGSYYWSAQYQQKPTPREGGMFKAEWLPCGLGAGPDADRVRYWDRAATQDDGDYTVGLLMAREPVGTYVVEDVVRGRWSSGRRDDVIRKTAESDATRYPGKIRIWGEQEPGSGGKDAALAFVKLLEGFSARTEPATGDKATRAEPFAAQAEAGHVRLARGAWVAAYRDELCNFPFGTHDDQVDASSGAFNKLAMTRRFRAL